MTEAPPHMSMIPTEHARSWLLISGSRPEKFTTDQQAIPTPPSSTLRTGSCPRPKRRLGRAYADDWASMGGAGCGSTMPLPMIGTLACVLSGKLPGLDGVMLAKCESAQQIKRTADRLPPGTPILALI